MRSTVLWACFVGIVAHMFFMIFNGIEPWLSFYLMAVTLIYLGIKNIRSK